MTAHRSKPVKEIVMQTNHPKLNAARKTLLWLGVIVLAVFPFPWWL